MPQVVKGDTNKAESWGSKLQKAVAAKLKGAPKEYKDAFLKKMKEMLEEKNKKQAESNYGKGQEAKAKKK